jgi:hypothetical protein
MGEAPALVSIVILVLFLLLTIFSEDRFARKMPKVSDCVTRRPHRAEV